VQGRFAECEDLLKDANLDLGYVYLRTGNLEKALKEAKKYPERRLIPYVEGVTYTEMGSLDKAQEAAQALAEIMEKEYEKSRFTLLEKFHKNLEGRIELGRKNFPEAIILFEEALSLLREESFLAAGGGARHAFFFEPLARAYYKSGDLGKAADIYSKITELTLGRLYYGDIYAKSFYMLGKIYEEQGDKTKAIANYEKFLDIWKDADPGIEQVEDAKKRLAAL
jgi:tetratricopeptide (TPR) repeat protein